MSSTTAAAPGMAGAWFGELAAALQGRWQQHQAAVTSSEHQRPRQQPKKLGAGGLALAERNNKPAAVAAKVEEGEDVGLCGAAMSDTTLYMLLDRFTPN
ncbi:hypothetical protein PR202_gb24117 [Eleusine coracana subsp. coracana]|uniref:Uncharacterized protein n=1 Tax=Eleusine coracana subsp. coracana TaxID=191504 RepID=A0AAV5FK82_ELECO|nr:hypothetical protein PR202_gb24117 [Eleusine coracana subsp. coracana]